MIDARGMYWFDDANTLHALFNRVESVSRPLHALESDRLYVTGMVSDESTLYWGQASGEPPDTWPPGRLYSIAKAGGEPTLLLEEPEAVLRPMAVVGERIVVSRSGSLISVGLDGSVELLAPGVLALTATIVRGKLYWHDEQGVWRSALDGSGAERISRTQTERFLTDGNYTLWIETKDHEQNYAMCNHGTDCVQPLPALGEMISYSSAIDGQHVYWFSYDARSASSGQRLVRVDLETGAFELLATRRFEYADLVGQNSGALYLRERGRILAVHKP